MDQRGARKEGLRVVIERVTSWQESAGDPVDLDLLDADSEAGPS